jgi:hypothetical protein
MKKFIALFLLFFIPFTCAVDIDMKSDFNQGETITAKFSGNFLEKVSEDNLFFYRGHTRIPVEFDILNIGDDYYIYAVNDKSPENYSLYLENVKYYQQGKIVDEPISKNFTITDEFTDFSINPGLIMTTKDFEIEMQNFQDKEIIVKINQEIFKNDSEEKGFFESLFGNLFLSLTGSITLDIEEQNSITLSPNEIKNVEFKLGAISEPTTKKISFDSGKTFYEFVLYIPSSVKGEHKTSLNFEPSELKISLSNATQEEVVKLKNVGEELLENITIYVSSNLKSYVNVSKNEIYNLDVNQSADIYLLFSPTNKTQIITGELTAKIPNETEDLVIIFEMFGTESNQTTTISKSKTCQELNGTIFEEPQICDGEERFAKDGNCCIGKIVEPKKSSTGLIIGWIIILVIIVVLIWFFKFKYKKSQGEIDLFKIARGKN